MVAGNKHDFYLALHCSLSYHHQPSFIVGTPEQIQHMMTEDTNGDAIMGIYCHF